MKISIITVCYNSEKTIADTMRSTRLQAYENLEHIIVDGGSKDRTLAIIAEEIMKNHKVVSEKDDGIYDAMNKGIALASGDLIGFINADDFYPSQEILSTVVAALEVSGADCCYGDLCYVQQSNIKKIVRYWRSSAFTPGLFSQGWCPPHPTFFVRREVYLRLGNFNSDFRIAADVELMARFLEKNCISSCYIPKVLVHMRMGGISNRSLSNIVKLNFEVRRGLLRLGLNFSWWQFAMRKIFSRILQFIEKPS